MSRRLPPWGLALALLAGVVVMAAGFAFMRYHLSAGRSMRQTNQAVNSGSTSDWLAGPELVADGFRFVTIKAADPHGWTAQAFPLPSATAGYLCFVSPEGEWINQRQHLRFYRVGDGLRAEQEYALPRTYRLAGGLAWTDGKVLCASFPALTPDARYGYQLLDAASAEVRVSQQYFCDSPSMPGPNPRLAQGQLVLAAHPVSGDGAPYPLTLWRCPAGQTGVAQSAILVFSIGDAWRGGELRLAAIDAAGRLLVDGTGRGPLQPDPHWAHAPPLEPMSTAQYLCDVAAARSFALYRAADGLRLATPAGETHRCPSVELGAAEPPADAFSASVQLLAVDDATVAVLDVGLDRITLIRQAAGAGGH